LITLAVKHVLDAPVSMRAIKNDEKDIAEAVGGVPGGRIMTCTSGPTAGR
jgi:hypothetical protein